MIATELQVGDWVKFEYNGRPRFGCVEEKRYAKYGIPVHEGWLVKTSDGYRHCKVRKMHGVELVR